MLFFKINRPSNKYSSQRTSKLPTKLNARSTGIAALLLTLAPGVWTYAASFIDKIRSTELDYVNLQIEKLYGPLYALTEASSVAWDQFHNMHWPAGDDRYFFDPRHKLRPSDVDQWRNWMSTVFQPLNIKVETVIVENSQLVIGNEMPQVFKEAIAQTEAYKAVIGMWKPSDRDTSAYTTEWGNTVTGLNYPDKIGACVKSGYTQLKQRQQQLQRNAVSVLITHPLIPDASCQSSSRQPWIRAKPPVTNDRPH
ncbi:hypothetical protein [Caballeronia sp. DA-9]|uniref:hypothetical protein n=1 Tax=Caballeronia sp. DA-9 TaxID=3436237 RepID=UPI003F67B7BC